MTDTFKRARDFIGERGMAAIRTMAEESWEKTKQMMTVDEVEAFIKRDLVSNFMLGVDLVLTRMAAADAVMQLDDQPLPENHSWEFSGAQFISMIDPTSGMRVIKIKKGEEWALLTGQELIDWSRKFRAQR